MNYHIVIPSFQQIYIDYRKNGEYNLESIAVYWG